MKIKVSDLKEGQEFQCGAFWYTAAKIERMRSAYVVWLKEEENNPFISSQFASFRGDSIIEVHPTVKG